jgi:hypothetical protein
MRADEGMAAEQAANKIETGRPAAAKNTALSWLSKLLSNGVMHATQVKEACNAAGINYRTVQRAADELKVIREKGAFNSGWTWRLPILPSGQTSGQLPLTHGVLSSVQMGETPEERETSITPTSHLDKFLFCQNHLSTSGIVDAGMRTRINPN